MTVTYLGTAEDTFVIQTTYGYVAIDLLTDQAPINSERLKTLARDGAYDNVAFHRVIDGFVAQGGDVLFGDLEDGYNPFRVGTGDSIYPDIVLEPTDLSFERGVLGIARSSALDSANSQFFITTDDATFLDPDFDEDGNVTSGFTAVGLVLGGMNFVDQLTKIAPQTIEINGQQVSAVIGTPDRMLDVFVADDLAPGRTSVGTGAAEKMVGGGEAEAFFGLGGADTIKAAGGRDWIASGDGHDRALGNGGRDEIDGGTGHDSLAGGGGADTLLGGNGRDTLKGGNGADLLNGGAGNDELNGGKGDDTFVFDVPEFGTDTITGGFDLNDDIIDLRGSGYLPGDVTLEERNGDTHVLLGDKDEIVITGETGLIGAEDSLFLF